MADLVTLQKEKTQNYDIKAGFVVEGNVITTLIHN